MNNQNFFGMCRNTNSIKHQLVANTSSFGERAASVYSYGGIKNRAKTNSNHPFGCLVTLSVDSQQAQNLLPPYTFLSLNHLVIEEHEETFNQPKAVIPRVFPHQQPEPEDDESNDADLWGDF